jgi:hypothetical protein
MSDKHDPDDVNTSGDDHWVDAWRYGAMSRLVASRRPPTAVHVPEMSLRGIAARNQMPDGILAPRR